MIILPCLKTISTNCPKLLNSLPLYVGKIWIQHDGTEIGIADELVKLQVPRE
jgi:hypothetical protein